MAVRERRRSVVSAEEIYRHPHDYALEVGARQIGDIAFWEAIVRRERPRHVLEIGCGTGRLTIPLARLGAEIGCAITGLDMEQAMLDYTARLIEREPVPVRERLMLVQGDMRHFHLEQAFDVILCPYGVIHHIQRLDEQLMAWHHLFHHLHPGGLVGIDVQAPRGDWLAQAAVGMPRTEDLSVTGDDGTHLRRSVACQYDPATQQANLAYQYHIMDADGTCRAYASVFSMHIYFPREICLLCRMVGLQIEHVLGSYTEEPFGVGSQQLIVLARRPGVSRQPLGRHLCHY